MRWVDTTSRIDAAFVVKLMMQAFQNVLGKCATKAH
jgi:hypothetical protein